MKPTGQVSKGRARVTLVAGAFIVVLMSAVWIFVANLLAGQHERYDAATAAFLGRMYVSFAIVIVCGILGVVNGMLQLKNGRSNIALSIAIIVLFAAAIGTVAFSLPSSQ